MSSSTFNFSDANFGLDVVQTVAGVTLTVSTPDAPLSDGGPSGTASTPDASVEYFGLLGPGGGQFTFTFDTTVSISSLDLFVGGPPSTVVIDTNVAPGAFTTSEIPADGSLHTENVTGLDNITSFTINAPDGVIAIDNIVFTGGTPAGPAPGPANATPVLSGLDGTPIFTEGASNAVTLDNDVTVSDTELDALNAGGGNYSGATLTIARNGGANSNDQFSSALGLTEGDLLIISGTPIGAVTQNSAGTLVLTFHSGATTSLVNQAIQSLQYKNISNAPAHSAQLNYSFSDGSSVGEGNLFVNLFGVNEAPVFSNVDATPTFFKDGGAVVLDANATIADTELDALESGVGDYNGATLKLERMGGPNAEDQFSGTGTLNSLTEGGSLAVDGITIGTVTTNSNGTLLLTFNTSATTALVNSALQKIGYSNGNNSETLSGSVQINYTFDDGNVIDQGTGGSLTDSDDYVTVTLAEQNRDPVISNLDGDVVRSTEAGLTSIHIDKNGDALVSDLDSSNFDGGVLTVTFSGGLSAGDSWGIVFQRDANNEFALSGSDLQNNGVTIGTFSPGQASGLAQMFTFSFNSVATPEIVSSLINQLALKTTSSSSVVQTVDFSFVLTDGDGGASETSTTKVVHGQQLVQTVPEPMPALTTEVIDGRTITAREEPTASGGTARVVQVEPVGADTTIGGASDQTTVALPGTGDDSASTTVTLSGNVGLEARSELLTDLTAEDMGDRVSETLRAAGASEETVEGVRNLLGLSEQPAGESEQATLTQITLTENDNSAEEAPVIIARSPSDNIQDTTIINTSQMAGVAHLNLNNVDRAVLVGGDAHIRGGEGPNILYAGSGSQDILLGADDDELHGGAGDDTVGSEGGDDKIFGEAGNDIVFGGAGKDILHGGADTDTATYEGNLADYTVTSKHGVVTVTRKNDESDSDTVINVEHLQFADQTVDTEVTTENQAIATLYKNILGRQADLAGFEWWNEHLNNGGNLGDMALSFLRSEEYKQTNNKDFDQLPVALQVEELYKAVLGREADTEGRAFWVEQMLAGGELNRITSSFINSVELTGQVTQQTDWEFSIS